MINSSNRCSNIRRIVVVTALALVEAVAGGAFAVTHTISSLPYTCSVSNDTLTLSGNLSAVGRAITVNSGIRNVYIKGGGYTITFNTANTSGVTGISLASPRFITIENLTLIQSGNASENIGISVGEGDSTFLNNCGVHVRGYDSRNVFSGGTRDLRISHGNYTSYVTDFSRRDLFTAAAIYVDDGYGNNGDWSDPQTWRVWIRHITIDSCPHAALYLRGGRIIVDSCDITVDAQVGYTYPSGNMYYGIANAYCIIADRDAKDSRIIGNTLRSGTNHLGGRGILIENSQDARFIGTVGYSAGGEGMEIAHNDINVHAGPDPYYGGSYQVVGLRIRNDFGFDSLFIHDNIIFVEADTATATNHTGLKACGMWFSGPGSNSTCSGWRIENNQVTAQGKPGLYARRASGGDPDNTGSYARAFVLDQDLDDGDNRTLNNRFTSNVTPVCFGEVNSWSVNSGENWTMCGDTIVRLSPDYSDNYNNDAAIVMNLYGGDAENNALISPRFLNDTTVAIAASESGPAELLMRKIVILTVLDKNGVPVEGATVGMRDARGVYQVNGTTDSYGRLVDTISFRYYHWGIGSDTTYNPFVQYAKYAIDSTGKSKSFGVNTDGSDIIVLSNTVVGTGELDTVPPATVGDLSAAPAAVTGHMTFGWTSTGDDSTVGTASYDSIRYSTAPIDESNWTHATIQPRTASPKASGAHDQVDIAALTPVAGRFYYVGIRAYDNLNNASPLAVTSGFARGILRPQISSDSTVVDQGAQQVTFFAAVVPSYLEHYYQFQLDSDQSFSSPATVNDIDLGTYAEASFALPAEGETVLVRCRAVALDQSETSPWSPTRAFSVSGGFVNAPPSPPTAFSPVADDIVASLRPTLAINNGEDPDQDVLTYEFEVLNSAGSTTLASSGLIAQASPRTTWTIPVGVLRDTTDYTWRARSFDGEAYSAWMDLVLFSVYVLATGNTPAEIIVHAYPNPVRFASGELATFVLPDEPVDLTILTVSGNVVIFRSNVFGQWQWDGANQSGSQVAAGVYPWFLSDNRGRGKLVVKP